MGKVYAKIEKATDTLICTTDDPTFDKCWVHRRHALSALAPDLSPSEPRELRVWGPTCVDMRDFKRDFESFRIGSGFDPYAALNKAINKAIEHVMGERKAQEQPTPAPDPSSPLVDVRIMPQWQRGHYLTAQFHKDDVFNLAIQHAVRCWDAREKKGGAA